MTKGQFLEELRCALKGELPENEINANVAYYNDYIMESMQRGRTEQQVFEELGSPQWIARTIVSSYEADRTYDSSGDSYQETFYQSGREFNNRGERKMDRRRKHMEKLADYMVQGFPWYYKAAGIVMLVVVLAVLCYIGAFITKMIVQIAVPLLLLYILWSIFFRKK